MSEPIEIKPGTWLVEVEDAGDGSGDAIVALPQVMLDDLGWCEGDEIKIEIAEDGSFYLSKAD